MIEEERSDEIEKIDDQGHPSSFCASCIELITTIMIVPIERRTHLHFTAELVLKYLRNLKSIVAFNWPTNRFPHDRKR